MPPEGQANPGDGLQGQVLLKLGEISADVKVIQKVLEAVPDHETRLRALEQARAESKGGRDTTARWLAIAGVAAAVASPIVVYLHH